MKMANLKIKNLKVQPLRGVTLIELLIAIALAGIVGVLVAGIYFANQRLFSEQQTSIAVADQSRLASDEITGQVRQSEKIVKTCGGCGGVRTAENSLILRAWPTDVAGNPVAPAGCFYDYIVYQRNPTKNTLTKQVIPHSTSSRPALSKVVATDVVDLRFAFDSDNPAQASQVTTNVKTQASTIFGKTHSSVSESKAVLRNR